MHCALLLNTGSDRQSTRPSRRRDNDGRCAAASCRCPPRDASPYQPGPCSASGDAEPWSTHLRPHFTTAPRLGGSILTEVDAVDLGLCVANSIWLVLIGQIVWEALLAIRDISMHFAGRPVMPGDSDNDSWDMWMGCRLISAGYCAAFGYWLFRVVVQYVGVAVPALWAYMRNRFQL